MKNFGGKGDEKVEHYRTVLVQLRQRFLDRAAVTTEVTVPLMKDINTQDPTAICQVVPNNNSTNLLLNRSKPPFDNADIRRAAMLALDRKAFIQILGEGQDTDEPGSSARTEEVIAADGRLSDDQKAALIAVYRSMVAKS